MSARRRATPGSLRYVCDAEAGLRRVRRGRAFGYVDARGRRVADDATLERIRRLAIPPAYVDVWICRDARGHLQATGRDARGRKQYRYHREWRAFRDRRKYDGLREFGAALPALRRRVVTLLRAHALSREKVLAAVVALLDATLIRIGNEEYARTNSSYGLTTLRTRHAQTRGSRVALQFRGKTGKAHRIVLSDARLARIVKRCRELPGQRLFQYLDENGRVRPVRSNDVNAFLRELTGLDVTARTFRTWGATTLLVEHWLASLKEKPELTSHARLAECVAGVAAKLGNTATVCRNAYLDPRVVAALESGAWPDGDAPRRRGLSAAEARVLDLLRRRIR
jgi:DNA topoisomerase-1